MSPQRSKLFKLISCIILINVVLTILGSPIVFGILGVGNENWVEMVQRMHQNFMDFQQNNVRANP